MLYQNHYICYKCAHTWQDDYECMVDDECPKCGAKACSPVESYEYPQHGDRYLCTSCKKATAPVGLGELIMECPHCGSKNLDCILPDGTVKFGQRGRCEPVTLRLTLTVTYDTFGTPVKELFEKLAEIVANATGEGAFTGETTAECDVTSEIEDISENWKNDAIQFPRLIAEAQACGGFEATIPELAEEMDLTTNEVCEIIERAQRTWDKIKSETP